MLPLQMVQCLQQQGKKQFVYRI
uniref:Uncharacterized protein n=1 Tax=Rhizophora mucronata TaxID=61149 RepID=A0A2P2QE04_RHIMU